MANLLSRDHGPLAPVTDPIYHYTSADGLLGALRDRRLWASQATSLNDHAEIRQGWDLIIEILRDLLGEHPEDTDLEMMLNWARNPLDEVRHVCVVCASLRGDDANQWRLYGGASRGYSIELDPKVQLSAVVDAEKPPALEPTPGRIRVDFDVIFVSSWLRVIYDPADLRQAVRDLWRAVADETAPTPDPSRSRVDQEIEHSNWWHELQAVALNELATLAHLVKTEGFSGEHEVRMVLTHLLGSPHFKYRPGANGIIGYRELAWPPEDHPEHRLYFTGVRPARLRQLPVRSVRVGPLTSPGHEETVQDYLDTVNLKGVPVVRSEIPLR